MRKAAESAETYDSGTWLILTWWKAVIDLQVFFFNVGFETRELLEDSTVARSMRTISMRRDHLL